jgi:hypothetical protein
MDQHSNAAWIRIPNADQDPIPGGLKSAKRKAKRSQKKRN